MFVGTDNIAKFELKQRSLSEAGTRLHSLQRAFSKELIALL